MADTQRSPHQFTGYFHEAGINWFKIVTYIKELDLSLKERFLDFNKLEHKSEWYRKLTPNGRVPLIVDHWNNDKVVWESNSVLLYIGTRYDKERKFMPETDEQMAELNTWLFFQASHIAPTFGQVQWFMHYHDEVVPSAITRYMDETKRILSVLNDALEGKDWLIANKFTIADLSFTKHIDSIVKYILPAAKINFDQTYPNVANWYERMKRRPIVRAMLERRVEHTHREGQHVTGETVSSFSQRAEGIAKGAIPLQANVQPVEVPLIPIPQAVTA